MTNQVWEALKIEPCNVRQDFGLAGLVLDTDVLLGVLTETDRAILM